MPSSYLPSGEASASACSSVLYRSSLACFCRWRCRGTEFRGKGAVNFLILAPFLVPHIVLAVGVMLVLGPLGLLDSYTGIFLAHLGITTPYTVRTITMSLMAVDRRVEAARVHGASPAMVLWRITLPLVRPVS